MLLYLLFIVTEGLFDENPHITPVTSDLMRLKTENPDYTVISVIHDNTGQASIALDRVLSELSPRFQNFVKFIALNCDDEPGLCQEDTKASLPIFQAFVPAGINPYNGKPLVNQRPYQGVIGAKEISEFFTSNIPFLGDTLTNDNNKEFFDEKGNKAVLFTNKDKVPLIFRGLASKYRARLEFGVVFDKETQLLEYYNVKEFPTLIVIENDEIIRYSDKIEFKEISNFLENYVSAEKKPLKYKKTNTKPSAETKDIKLPEFPIIELSSEKFAKHIQDETSVLLVHFIKDKPFPEWEEIKNDYNGIVKLATFSCNTKEEQEICQSSGVKKYPSIRLFPVNKKRKSFELSFKNRADLEEEISRELRFDITSLHEATINTYLSSIQEEQKVACLLITDGPIPLQFKGIASEPTFKDFVKFAYFNRPKEQALSIFGIKSFPAIIAFAKTESENLQVIEYSGKFEDYKSLYFFVDKSAIPLFLNKQTKSFEEEQEEIDAITDGLSLNSKCLRKKGVCVIGFFENQVKNI